MWIYASIEVYQILFDVCIFPHLINRILCLLIISRVYELYYTDINNTFQWNLWETFERNPTDLLSNTQMES